MSIQGPSVTEPWTEVDHRIRLLSSRDRETGRHYFPPLPQASPLAPRFETVPLSPTATLYSYTVIHPAPRTGHPPFVLAYADFPEGVRVLGRLQVAAGLDPRIGSELALIIEATPGGGQSYAFIQGEVSR